MEPTVIVAKDAHFKTMEEEIFGPVVTIYVYPADDFGGILQTVDSTEYALTGAVFARERYAIDDAMRARKMLPATSTSTTSRPALLWANNRSAVPGDRDQRQGGILPQPPSLGQPADDQGNAVPADRLPLPVPPGLSREEQWK